MMGAMLGHVGHAAGHRRADLVLDCLGLQYQIACNVQICKIVDTIGPKLNIRSKR